MMQRRRGLGGSIPQRVTTQSPPDLDAPGQLLQRVDRRLRRPRSHRPPWASPACCATSARDSQIGERDRTDHSRRGPHLRHGLTVSRVEDLRLARPEVRARRPRHVALLRRSHRWPDLGRGHHRSRVVVQLHRRWHGLRHSWRADGAVLHLLFDVRIPAGRRPDLAGRRRPCQGFPARRYRRAHDADGRRPAAPRRPFAGLGQHGSRRARSYDPAFAYEVASIVKAGLQRMYGAANDDVFYYITLYNENYPMPAMPERATIEAEILGGLYRWQERTRGAAVKPPCLFSGSAHTAARQRRVRAARALRRRRRTVVGDLVQGACAKTR